MLLKKIALMLICLSGVFLASCEMPGTGVEESSGITVSQYRERFSATQEELPPGVSSYGIFVSQESDSDMYGKTMVLDDLSTPIYFTCSHRGKADTVVLTIYYDYKQIPFFVDNSSTECSSYRFQLEDNQEIQIPIILSGVTADESRHKLLFSITTEADRHASSVDEVMNGTVLTHVCELKYSINTTDDMGPLVPSTEPDWRFHSDDVASLILNTDYDNSEIKETGLPALPPVELVISPNDTLELMYNITGLNDASSALLFVVVGNEQQEINGQDYLLFDVQNGETLNGKLQIDAPGELGAYEVFGYVVYNPITSVEETMFQLVETSFRFTLSVQEK